MTLQRVKAYAGLKAVTEGGNFPDELRTKETGLHQNCIFQSIWVNS